MPVTHVRTLAYGQDLSIFILLSPRMILLRELPSAQPAHTKVVLNPLVARTFVYTEDFPGASHGEIRKLVTRDSRRRPGCKCRSFQRGVHHFSVRQAILLEIPIGLIERFSVQIRAGS